MVSRAMSSFLVFGDMNCFSAAPRSSPRGQLGARLFSAADNVLSFAQASRRDLMHRVMVEHLQDAAAHLREALQIALQIGGWDADNLDNCGHLCAATGRHADAVTVWAAYAALNPQVD